MQLYDRIDYSRFVSYRYVINMAYDGGQIPTEYEI